MKNTFEHYENIIIGGGWSGIEAAKITAQAGKQVLLMIVNLDTLGWIQSPEEQSTPDIKKLLIKNKALLPTIIKNKGLASNRWEYCRETKAALDNLDNLMLRQDTATSVKKQKNGFVLASTSGQVYKCKNLIICAGTFIGSSISMPGYKLDMAGRDNETISGELSSELKDIGVRLMRAEIEYPATFKNQKGELSIESSKGVKVADGYKITYCVLRNGQVGDNLKHCSIDNLFFAGKCLGVKTTHESAITGVIAGLSAIGNKDEAKQLGMSWKQVVQR